MSCLPLTPGFDALLFHLLLLQLQLQLQGQRWCFVDHVPDRRFSSSSTSTTSCTCCLLLWPLCDYFSDSCELGHRCFALRVLLRCFFFFVLFVYFLIVVSDMFSFFLKQDASYRLSKCACRNRLDLVFSGVKFTCRSFACLTHVTYYSLLGAVINALTNDYKCSNKRFGTKKARI